MVPSVNNYTQSAATLSLLSPTVSWGQVRADRDRQLQFQAQAAQDAQQKKAASDAAVTAAQQAVSALYDVPFLEADQNRWKDITDGFLAENEKRIKTDYAGDHERYAQERYAQDTNNLILKATRHPFFKQALKRRSDAVQLMADQSKGLIDRPVTYRLLDGKLKTAPATENYLDFQAGRTNDFTYNGGYSPPTKYTKFFSENYSPKVAQAGKFTPIRATGDEVLSAAITHDGMNPSDAVDYFSRFGSRLQTPVYKFEPKDPYREEQLAQGREHIRLGKERNVIARERNAISKAQGSGQIDLWDATFNNQDNIITRGKDGQPGTMNVSLFDNDMRAAGSGKLQGFTGKAVGSALLEATGAVYNKKTDTYQGAGGEAYVSVKNQSGGIDLRATDLTGLAYETKPGNVFRYETPPTEYEKATGRKPYRYLQEQKILLSSDEAKKAKAGQLFRGIFNIGNDYSSGFNPFGNADTPTGKGAYKTVERGGKKFYEFTIMQPVQPTMLDRQEATYRNMSTQTKTGQAVLGDADDDLNYY